MIIDDYVNYSKTYKQKYGDRCVVLIQVGSFYECYSITDNITEDIYIIADICNIQISRKNKSIYDVSISNPLMAGFPLYTLNKYTQLLLNNNYTIVLVEQVTEPPNPEREITEILSPSMNINVSHKKTNYLIVIYYEFIDNLPIVGIGAIDLTTGNTFIYEIGSTKTDPELVNDEVYRIISTYNPTELVIMTDDNINNTIKNSLLKSLNLSNILVHFKWNTYEYIKSMKKISYQSTILEKAFSNKKNIISIIDALNIERYNLARIAFCCAIQFAYEHNADIIKELNEPIILNNNKIMTIEYNSSLQLNIVSSNQNDKPLSDILNRCVTSFASRAFKERLLNPIIDTCAINKRYDEIDFMLKDNLYENISKKLSNIIDLERIKRRLIINKFNPQDWYGFNVSLNSIQDIIELIDNISINDNTIFNDFIDIEKIKEIKNNYNDILNIDLCSKYNLNEIKGNIFKKGVYKNIDKLEEDYNKNYNIINDISIKINAIVNDNICKIESNDKDSYYISMTKKRYDTVKNINPSYMKDFQIKVLSASNNIKLTNKEIINASTIIDEIETQISSISTKYYIEFIKIFSNLFCDYNGILDKIIKYIINIDIACCNAKNAYEYRYYRPQIINKDNTSYINAKNIRHPIIERIDTTSPYVGNDILLTDNNKGILLYGINASGKSSYMKTVGLNIIMAQSGMFVPSQTFIYFPYHHIFTRISGMDNIYRGMSSFTVEMTELRNILQRCNKYSLVIGDEICCGTESTSAIAIVASGINTLISKKSSFIFATHLHELTNIAIVKKHINENVLNIKHVHITIEDNNRIIYDRKIQNGQGSSIYGIEVCKTLDLPNDFMKMAEDIRKEIQGHDKLIVSMTPSKYNNKLYVDKCFLCDNKAIDIHHINYQSNSDDNGFFKDYHKNIKHNLIPLCKECHNKEHNGNINIKGYVKTSHGLKIDYEDDNKSLDINIKDEINDDIELNEEQYIKLQQYIKRGKLSWYIRNNKTTQYKACIDDKKIIEKINKLLKTNFKDISIDLHNRLFDIYF